MTMKPKVEIYHRRNVKQYDNLARSVNKVWRDVEEQKLTKIWERFLRALDILVQDQGGNNLVEIYRGMMGVPE